MRLTNLNESPKYSLCNNDLNSTDNACFKNKIVMIEKRVILLLLISVLMIGLD